MSDLTTTTAGALQVGRALPADQNPALVYLAGLGSESGRRAMRTALENMAALLIADATLATFPWARLRFQHTAAIRAQLAEQYAPATVNRYLAALRGTLKAAWHLGQMTAEDYQRARVPGVKTSSLPAGRELASGEIAAIMEACAKDHSAAGARDGALFALLYAGGLRRAEVVDLDLGDYGAETGELRVVGKGRKERIVWVAGGARDALGDWLAVRGDEPGPLFAAVNRGGRLAWETGRLTSQAVYHIMAKRAAEAGVKHFSPHDLRRTFVSNLLDAGADITTVSKMAGHASVTTTARYDRRGEQAKRKAASMLHVPWQRRRMESV